MSKLHSFHIPVLGVGFSLDTPIKVAHLGIDSVVSLADDTLLEKLRKLYSEKFELPYQEIENNFKEFRSERITSYLNLVNDIVNKKVEELKKGALSNLKEIQSFISELPDSSTIKQVVLTFIAENKPLETIKEWLHSNFVKGSIDVNIMTKVDKANYFKREKLPTEYNDAHAAIRGYAESDLESSVILSAGLSPRLYSYISQFKDFYPDERGYIKKKVVIKVSDFRSALVQGKFFAKKGIWVSEYRIESGLNCGGHAFATEGHLLGPILEEFKTKKQDLLDELNPMISAALEKEERQVPKNNLTIKISAQGGVGTSEEHSFLMEHYNVDFIGWGTPFLLVPDVTNVDEKTLEQLQSAKEEDLYLSNISPLGVPFNNLRGNTKDQEKMEVMNGGKVGSTCPKKYLALNNEFNDKGMCTASRAYLNLKIKELKLGNLSKERYDKAVSKLTEKSCICVGLGTSVLLNNGLNTKREGEGVSVCPGPNMAYFSKKMSLRNMVDHIYGRSNVIERSDRPNMFIKELSLYLEYLKNEILEGDFNPRKSKRLKSFIINLNNGISYYQNLFENNIDRFKNEIMSIQASLIKSKTFLAELELQFEQAN